jgi:hypothetical protein
MELDLMTILQWVNPNIPQSKDENDVKFYQFKGA